MAKRVILSVAGSGKTYYICHNIDKNKKNLILTYTHENIKNIRNELINAFGSIPELTTILTFDSFVYRHMVLPYEPSILKFFNQKDFKTKGITLKQPEQRIIKDKINYKYISKDKIGHYVTRNGFYYCARLSELVINIIEEKNFLVKRISRNINNFYDKILIDEFQDFREYDFGLIMSLSKEIDNMILVGDYYQHSVLGKNNSGQPFKNKKVDISYQEFKSTIENLGFEIVENLLENSRRCPKNICDFVHEKLNIQIRADNNNVGSVIFIKDDIEKLIEDDSIVKLMYWEANKYKFNAINWSYSKGDTFENVCVILTDTFENLDVDNFVCNNISQITINKLYVALTRTKGNLYIVKNSDFKKIKMKYKKNNAEYKK